MYQINLLCNLNNVTCQIHFNKKKRAILEVSIKTREEEPQGEVETRAKTTYKKISSPRLEKSFKNTGSSPHNKAVIRKY